ncbi:MAG: hypothetical protein WCV88_03800 [Patescibacteria group bacterium]|jgi:hypothetical protein
MKRLAFSLEFDSDKTLQTYTKLGNTDPVSIVFTIVNTALVFLGVVTLVLIIVAGFLWLTAGGNEEQIKKSKDIMKGAVIGLVIVLGSYGIAQYLFTAIQLATTS